MILLYDDRLWNLIYQWTQQLERSLFLEILPYLRRAFSRFDPRERKMIGQRAQKGLQLKQNMEQKHPNDYPLEALALPILDTLQQLISDLAATNPTKEVL